MLGCAPRAAVECVMRALLSAPAGAAEPRKRVLAPSLLANRSACFLALHRHGECEADCTAALEHAADLAPRPHAKLLLRRAMARRARGAPTLAANDLARAGALQLDVLTRAELDSALAIFANDKEAATVVGGVAAVAELQHEASIVAGA